MIPFKSYSQAGQDRFVFELLGSTGTFLDVGCNHPTVINNTYALEQQGWHGLLLDNEPTLRPLIEPQRTSPFHCADTGKIQDWFALLAQYGLASPIDYLSMDVDGGLPTTMRSFPFDTLRFRVLTIEHNRYLWGDDPRNEYRDIVMHRGYELLCADVRNENCPFEDWWVDPTKVDMTLAEKFRSSDQEWSSFVHV